MKIQKKFFVSLLMIISVVLLNTSFALATGLQWYNPETGEILATEPPPQVPLIRALEPSVITQTAGTTKSHEITLRNIGSGRASNVLVTARASAESEATVRFLDMSHSFSGLASNFNRSMQLEITIPPSAKAGTYTIRLEYNYSDNANEKITSNDEITLRIENEQATPNLILVDLQTSSPEVKADSAFEITGVLRNTTIAEATDVRLIASGFASETLSLLDSSNNIFVQSIKGNETQDISFRLRTNAKIKQGSYPITFRLSYRDADKNTHTNEYEYYVNVSAEPETASDEKALLQITHITTPTHEINVGQEFSSVLSIINTGEATARNIKITAQASSDAIVPKSANIQQIISLPVGQSSELNFRFAPTATSITQNYPISFLVEYDNGLEAEDAKNRSESFTQYIGVNVKNAKKDEEAAKAEEENNKKDDENISVPKIIVSKYQSDPVIVQAGKEFDLSMTFMNTHREVGVRNIDATLTVVETSESKGNVFTPVDSSNSFYIERISPMGEVEKVLRFSTVPDASPKNYQIQITMNYEDDKGNEYTSTKLIGINVKQVMRLETSDISVPEYVMVGESVYLSFSLYNTGRVKLNNLMVRVEGEFDTSNAEYYIGAFDIGNSDYYDGYFIPYEEGPQQGKVVISYEDDMGEEIVTEIPFTVQVQGMPSYDMDFGDRNEWMMEPETSSSNTQTGAGIVVGIILAAAAIFFGRKKLIQLRKERDFDE